MSLRKLSAYEIRNALALAELANQSAATYAGTATTQAGIATAQAVIATTQAGIATDKAAATDAGRIAAEAAAAAAAADRALVQTLMTMGGAPFANAYATTLPKGVTALSGVGVGTGSGGTAGTYAGGVSGGPAGFAWTYTIGSDGKIASYTVTNRGLATATTAPTLTYPSGSITGATVPVATVASIIPDQIAYAVASADSLSVLIYRNNGGSVAAVNNPDGSQVAMPNANGLNWIAQGNVGWSTGHAAALDRIVWGKGDGASPTYFRRISNIFYRDAGSRFSIQIDRATDAAGTGATQCGYLYLNTTDPADYVGLKLVTVPAANGSGETWKFCIDFGNGTTPFSGYSLSWANNRIPRNLCAPIDPPSATFPTRNNKLPFDDAATSIDLCNFFSDAWAYGCDPAKMPYYISLVAVSAAATPSVTVAMKDNTGTQVCYATVLASGAMTLASFIANELPSQLRLQDYEQGTKTGIVGNVTLIKSKLVEQNVAYSASHGPLHPSRMVTVDQMRGYFDDATVAESIDVAAGTSTLRTAVDAIKVKPGGVYPVIHEMSHRAHYNRRVAFNLAEGQLETNDLVIPEYGELRGAGIGKTIILTPGVASKPTLQAHRSLKVRDLTVRSNTGDGGSDKGQYGPHIDYFNQNVLGPKPNSPIMQLWERCEFVGGALQEVALLGSGVSENTHLRFIDCWSRHEKPSVTNSVAAAWFFHNTGPTVSTPAIPVSRAQSYVDLWGGGTPDETDFSVYLQTVDHRHQVTVSIKNFSARMIYREVASGEVECDLARDRHQMKIVGQTDIPIYNVDSTGAWVLDTAPGTAVTGTAAAVIFGAVDDLGRGEKWIGTGAFTLGARLGDCSSVNKTLTIGGVTHTFNTNLTAASDATILTAINATFGANTVRKTDINLEQYPDTGFTRYLTNTSGAIIPKGRFVKLTAAKEIALAGPGDIIAGWTYRAIPNNAIGGVVTKKRAHTSMIEGAAGQSGAFGLAANGLLSMGATVKVGTVFGNMIELRA